jgi:hypothetical protein
MNIGIRRRSVRRTFLRDLVALIVVTAGTILAIWFVQNNRLRQQISQDQIHKAADQAVSEFNAFFSPIEQILSIFRKWGQAGILEPTEVEALNAKFIPILSDSDKVSSIIIADTDGVEYFLVRDQNTWLTRSTGLNQAMGRVLWQRWNDAGKLIDKWRQKLDYDPQERPWFQGALKSEQENSVFWTSPYVFYTLKTFGITASTKWQPQGNPAKTYVVALDVPLSRIVKTVTKITAGANGKTFLSNADGYVLKPDFNVADLHSNKNPDSLFIPGREYGLPIASHALEAWLKAGKPENEAFEYKSENKTCWAVLRPPLLRNSRVFIGVAAPESDFFGAVYNKLKGTIYIATAVLAGGVLLAVLLVRKYSYQLKDLPNQKLDRKDLTHQLIKLIENGESNILEFKSTMRMNLKTGKAGKEIELAWLKTVAAYMNTDGGILLIGVDDAGNMTGIETDNFESDDKCRLHFKNLIKQHIGLEFSKFITMEIISIEGKNIILIECERSSKPVFLKNKQAEDFYIRSGPSTVKLSVSEVLAYMEKRQS